MADDELTVEEHKKLVGIVYHITKTNHETCIFTNRQARELIKGCEKKRGMKND